jgi:hypothetical protein
MKRNSSCGYATHFFDSFLGKNKTYVQNASNTRGHMLEQKLKSYELLLIDYEKTKNQIDYFRQYSFLFDRLLKTFTKFPNNECFFSVDRIDPF